MLQASYVLEKVRGVTVSDACLTQVCKPQSNANASWPIAYLIIYIISRRHNSELTVPFKDRKQNINWTKN